METYIEYLSNNTNNTTDSEFSNFLKGGGKLNLEGGFPPIYECESISEQNITSRDKARNVTNINKKNLSSILDNRRKTPFIKISKNTSKDINRIDNVNSDSIHEINNSKNNIIGGFLNLFETETSSVILPQEISLVSIKQDSLQKINKDIVNNSANSSMIKQNNYQDNINSLDSIILPNNLDIINILNNKENKIQNGGTLSDTDTVVLPDNIEIINKIQNGGYEINDISSETELELPNNIEIINM